LHDFLEARVFPRIVGPVGRGRLQYTAMWKTAQRMTKKPIKFGTILPELIAASVEDDYYKDPVDRTWAISNALTEELHQLSDSRCPVVQMEEPQIHMVPARGKTFGKLDAADLVKIFNNTVKGLSAKTEVWCHTWGQPVPAAYFPRRPELPTDARGAQPGRGRRADVRNMFIRHRRFEGHRRGDQGQEGRHRRDRPSHPAGRAARRDRRPHPRGARAHSAGAADHFIRLRHGP